MIVQSRVTVGIIVAVLLSYISINLMPIFWMLVTSLKSVGEITSNPFGFPQAPTLANYRVVLSWTRQTVALAFDSTPLLPPLFLTLSTGLWVVFLSLAFALPAAYGMSRFRTGGGFLPFWFLTLLFAPPIVFAFPLFAMFQRLRLLDSLFGLVAANLIFSIPFATWIFYSTLQDAPKDFEEAAIVEGANYWVVFTRVVVPLLTPAVAAVGALTFIFVWGEYLFSVVLLNTQRTLTTAIAGYNTGQMVLYGAIASGVILVAIPAFIVLATFQRYLVRGLSFGTAK